MMRCCEIGIGWDMLDHLTVGTITDMMIEKGNDKEKYPTKATQEDIKAFFG